jgi:hypothetical protein
MREKLKQARATKVAFLAPHHSPPQLQLRLGRHPEKDLVAAKL